MFRALSESVNWRAVVVGWGVHGVMVAIPGFAFVVVAVVSAILIATAGIVLVERGISPPSVTLGFAGSALLASLALLALNLLGGKLGEWETGRLLGRSEPPSEIERGGVV